MMGMFSVFSVAGTGVDLHRTWLDAIANNIANVNTIRSTSQTAYQQQDLVATPLGGGPDGIGAGVQVDHIAYGNPNGILAYEPDHPLADAQGYVRRPDIDLAQQMSALIMAQRGYQANLAVVQRATDAYNAALQLGKI
jgi:flagellar basal-body rod protein FlgC